MSTEGEVKEGEVKEGEVKEGEVRTDAENQKILGQELIKQIEGKVPNFLKPAVKFVVPMGQVFIKTLNFLHPLISQGYKKGKDLWDYYEQYKPYDICCMIFGLILIFFGGHFVTTIAVIEAFRVSGWSQFIGGWNILWEDFLIVQKASQADDLKDDDGDGIADVKQISPSELISRKMKLFLTVCDPGKLHNALAGIYSGCTAVMATLRIKFARVITLGACIGEILVKPLTKGLTFVGLIPELGEEKVLDHFIPAEYHKWIPVVLDYICRSFGIYIAWMIQRVLSAFHSAIRGSHIFTEAFARWTKSQNMPVFITEGYFDEVFTVICAVIGIYIQITSWFSFPFLLWLLLFPFVLFESILSWLVAFQ